MSKLKNQLEEFFANKQLSAEQLSALQKTQKTVPAKSILNIWKPYAIAVSIVFLMTLAGFTMIIQKGGTLTEQIAKEVAEQHIKLKPLEVDSNSFTHVQAYFDKLDFMPVFTSKMSGELIGGRYCSLQSQPAAQFRFIDQNGKQQTLYQAEYTARFAKDLDETTQHTVYSKGLKVKIWVDRGVVFAVTSNEIE